MEHSRYSDGFFAIDGINGFLPYRPPLKRLPKRYADLQHILDIMPIVKEDGLPGLLAVDGAIKNTVEGLFDFSDQVRLETDPFIIQALFRGYAFLSSAYTLEPAHMTFKATGNYGKANRFLPEQLAKPFCIVAEKLEVYPWLDYHYAYSLGNFVKKNPNGGLEWENLEMAVKFSGMDDERGFIMLHVDINEHSPDLLKGIFETLELTNPPQKNLNDDLLLSKLVLTYDAMKRINARRKVMWRASRWKHYNDFRVFIMGIKGNEELFDEGVIYEGVDETPRQYRGQTGAQDNVIPTMDIFTGVINHYPSNDLTHYLLDLRTYRPICVQHFFQDLQEDIKKLHPEGLIGFLNERKYFKSMDCVLGLLDEIYLFRNGHWQFVQKYIMSNTKYAKATGGTPIISWIPNQIKAVFSAMDKVIDMMPTTYNYGLFNKLTRNLPAKKQLLEKQLSMLNEPNYSADEVYKLNKEYKLEDDNK